MLSHNFCQCRFERTKALAAKTRQSVLDRLVGKGGINTDQILGFGAALKAVCRALSDRLD